MSEKQFNSYDFVLNDDEEAMLLLYAHDSSPKNPNIVLNTENSSAVLYRNAEDILNLEDIPSNILDSLRETDKLLVCELSKEENDEDTQIVYAYEAEINN